MISRFAPIHNCKYALVGLLLRIPYVLVGDSRATGSGDAAVILWAEAAQEGDEAEARADHTIFRAMGAGQ